MVVLPELAVVEMALAGTALAHFIRQAWPIVEPKTPLRWGWHIDAISEHLEAVSDGNIKKLLINIPPRHMKSLTVCVFWPCWEWGPRSQPSTRWLFSSYAESLSKRDSLKCRRLITSDWYQSRWGEVFKITGDQNEKMRFENDKTGYRVATTVLGIGTGEGGDRIVVDDPHNVREGESDVRRGNVLDWWDESMSTRGNTPEAAKVIIMQRVHEGDLAGHVLSEKEGYVHLCLPARYESDRVVKTALPLDGMEFRDMRTEEGEPLWPAMYDDTALADLEKDMSEYAVAGQLQQRPAPRGGGLFKTENFKIINAYKPELVEKMVRYWDKAGTEGGGARTAGCLIARLKPNSGSEYNFIVLDVVKGQWNSAKRETIIKQTAEMDGAKVDVWVEQEPGSGGKESAESTIRNLAGFRVYADRVTGNKELRAEPYAAQVEVSNVALLNADWTKEFISEHEKFPTGKFKDQVDSAAGAFAKLNVQVKRAGVWGKR
jgi:predicted phage terminase large subunit-like protein